MLKLSAVFVPKSIVKPGKKSAGKLRYGANFQKALGLFVLLSFIYPAN